MYIKNIKNCFSMFFCDPVEVQSSGLSQSLRPFPFRNLLRLGSLVRMRVKGTQDIR